MIEDHLNQIKKGIIDFVGEEELIAKLKEGGPLRVKAGFDPTSADLHLGHTVIMQKLKEFQDMGHQIIFLIGDYTAQVGDPTGRNETRPMLSLEQIKENANTYVEQAGKILDINKTEVRYNSEWFEKMSALEFAQLGAMQTVARVLERDDFKKRMKAGKNISLLEFYYPLMQAYDSVALNADIELGGTEQLFNLLMGRTIQKRMGKPAQTVITLPLLLGTDGVQKMSKSYGNYVGIFESSTNMFGKIMSISDELMWSYYALLTGKNDSDIAQMQSDITLGVLHPKKIKQDLAVYIVDRFCGKGGGDTAKQEFDRVFSQKRDPETVENFKINIDSSGISIVDIIEKVGFVTSKSDARRMIKQKAVSIDGEKVVDIHMVISNETVFLLKVGKKRFARVDISIC